MNDLEFRRAVFEDPHHLSPEAQAMADASEANSHFVQEVRAMDDALSGALAVDVPGQLADRILLRQTLQDFERRQIRRSRWHLALAASVAFAVGALVTFMTTNRPLGYGDHALAHLYHEANLLNTVDESVSQAAFNKKLASYGGQLTGDIGHIYFANHCNFNGIRALHAIVQGQQGRITVFVVHEKDLSAKQEQAHFADQHYDGLADKRGQHQLIFIGEKGEPLKAFEARFSQEIQWQI